MSTPLIDIDANSRQPGYKPPKMGSKIPSPPKFRRTGSPGRHAPFSVSTAGSPSYIAMPTNGKAVFSPTPTSKLPRKSTPTQSAFSKSYTYRSRPTTPHESLKRPRSRQKPAAIVVPSSSVCWPMEHRLVTTDSHQDSIRTSPPLSCNKPLPSPPIAQIVNPASPPKAQRTLVDAEAGTPTEEVWPVLQPENFPPPRSPAPSINGMLPQRSASEVLASRRNGVPVLKGRGTTPSVSNSTPSRTDGWSGEEEQPRRFRPRIMTEPSVFTLMNPYSKSFHAYSTDSNVAMHSPLAYKQQTLPAVAIPPRISSKRGPLPSPDTAVTEPPAQLINSLRPANSGCTKWPTLAVAEESTKIQVDGEAFGNDQCLTAKTEKNESVSFDGADVTQLHYGSIDSASTWTPAAGLSLDDDLEVNHENSFRIKRLSWPSSNPGTGPTLRISADADAILLGRDESIPVIPVVPEHILRKPSHERSIGTLPGRISKQIFVKTDASAGSRILSPSLIDREPIGSKPVKITPIRSMQPPRKPSTGDLCKISPSLSSPASKENVKDQETLESSRAHSRGSVEATQESVSLHVDGTSTSSLEHHPLTKSESSMASVMLGKPSKNAYVGRLQRSRCLNANVSHRKAWTTSQHCRKESRGRLYKCWVQMQTHHNRQAVKACRCHGCRRSLVRSL